MNIKIFRSSKGDCLLISSGNKNILVDGGMSDSYKTFVAKEMAKLRTNGEKLDLVCVSHIDDDHIAGVLQMIENEVDWRVFDFHSQNGNKTVKKPAVGRPPEIKQLWHNAFHELLKDNTGDIEDMLAASANMLSASSIPVVKEEGELAFSKRQAIQLSRRLRAEQLNIPLNTQYGGKFVMYRKNDVPLKIGSLKLHIIAPFKADLDVLREEWNDWLRENKKAVGEIKALVDKDSDALGSSLSPNISFYQAMAHNLTPLVLQDIANKKMGVRTKVTAPNLASIMFLLEENGKTLLMTGDGHWNDIIKGLKAIGQYNDTTGAHLDVLKIQHHLSEHNINEEFCSKVTADHYIICGNGEHENPDIDALKLLLESRTTKPGITGKANNKFTIWINSSSEVTEKDKNKEHMEQIEKLLETTAKKHKNVKYKLMTGTKKFLTLSV